MKRKNCRWVKQNLADYIKGKITSVEMNFMRSHLEICQNCKDEEKFLRTLLSVIKHLPEYELSKDFSIKLKQNLIDLKSKLILEKKVPKSMFLRYQRHFLIPAFATALILLSIYLFLPKQPKIIIYNIQSIPYDLMKYTTDRDIALNEKALLRLRLKTTEKIENLMIDISLPEGIIFDEYKERTLTGKITLEPGENIIILKIKGVKEGEWQVKINLRKNSKEKQIIKTTKVIRT